MGTHSIISGSAMAMYLGGVPVFAIMMIGRWASNSFMKYIRMQIKEFTLDVSKRMLTMQEFWHVHQTQHQTEKRQNMVAAPIWCSVSESGVGINWPTGIGRRGRPYFRNLVQNPTPRSYHIFAFACNKRILFILLLRRDLVHEEVGLQSSNSVCCVEA